MKTKHADPVNTVKDRLVMQLNKRGSVRDDIWLRNCWASFSHMIAVYHMNDSINRIADQLPAELKRAA